MHFGKIRPRVASGIGLVRLLACCALMATAAQARGQEAAGKTSAARDALSPDRLRTHVFTLASDDFGGRRGKAAERTIAYIERHFEAAGLAPGFPQGYRQEVVQASKGVVIGTNLAAKVVGSDPVLKDEWIIVSAHWDHLGMRGGGHSHAPNEPGNQGADGAGTAKAGPAPKHIYAGADDNASGVAMLLETAAWFARPENRPKRSVLFVAFDLEEFGLFGSRHFAANSPVELSQIKLFITADMIGRSLSGLCREWVFVIGSERLPQSRRWITVAGADRPIRAGLLGTDLVGVRSDYGPFMTKKIPYLFFSTGESEVYHTTADRPETIDYAKLHQIAELIRETALQAAAETTLGTWSDEPQPAPEELSVIATVLEEMRAPDNGLKLGGLQKTTIERTLDKIRELVAKGGAISESDRRAVIRAAQFLMFTAL